MAARVLVIKLVFLSLATLDFRDYGFPRVVGDSSLALMSSLFMYLKKEISKQFYYFIIRFLFESMKEIAISACMAAKKSSHFLLSLSVDNKRKDC